MRDYATISKRLRRYSENCVAYKLDADFANAVTDAADAIEELLAEVPHWISVEERLPEEHVDVLICTEDYGKNVLGFAMTAVWDGTEWIETWDKNNSICCVTHWMPIPSPPKEGVEL